MESALPLVTVLRNETAHSIDFSVEEGSCPIRGLGPGGRRLVKLSEVVNICRRRQSTSWLIKVLIDQKLTGMTLEPEYFFEHVQILFKFRINEKGKLVLIAEGIKEKNIDIILRLSWNIGFLLGRNIIWSRRKYDLIAYALVESPMNMQQTRVCNLCSDVGVVPEAIVNSNKRSPLRKEESPQTESEDSVKHIEVNPSKSANCREENGLHLDNDTNAFIQSKKVASPESLFMSDNNVARRAEAQSIASGIRKTTATYTPLDRSKHDTFETKMSNSSRMEPLERAGNGSPDFHHYHHHHHHHYQYHYQQLLTEHVEHEHDHLPHSSHVPDKDTTDHIFLIVCAILVVGFVHILLLEFKFTR